VVQLMNIYYDFTKLDEFFNCAPSDPIEILSEEEMIEQGIIEPIEGGSNPNYIDGLSVTNPKEYKRRHYQKNKEKMKELHKQWAKENHDKMLQYKRKYNQKNKDIINQKTKERYYKRQYPCVCLFTGMVY